MSDRAPELESGLTPQYKHYKRQKCFIAYSERAPWTPDLLSACSEVLGRPKFDLEPDSARKHFKPGLSLLDKALELIANARYGIYDLSYWPDDRHEWEMPRNVLIELGIAIALNRPTFLLRHARNREAGLSIPECLRGCEDHIIEFGGESTLKEALQRNLLQWINVSPETDWWSRYCTLGRRQWCQYRGAHPQAKRWGEEMIRCEIYDGDDVDRLDFRAVMGSLLDRYQDTKVGFSDALSSPEGYGFVLCGVCQRTRSSSFGIYRISTRTPADAYIAYGMSVALEAQLGYTIPRILLTEDVGDVPSLLSGYEVIVACNDTQRRSHLREVLPTVMQQLSETPWVPRPLPFVETIILADREQPDYDFSRQISAVNLDELFNQIYEQAYRLVDLRNAQVQFAFYDGSKDVMTFPLAVEQDAGQLIDQVRWGNREPAFRQEGEDGAVPAFQPRSRGSRFGLTEYVFHTGKTCLIQSNFGEAANALRVGEQQVRVLPTFGRHGRPVQSWLGVPMIAAGRVVGVISVQSQEQEHAFDQHQVVILSELANQAAAVAANLQVSQKQHDKARRIEQIHEIVDDIPTASTDLNAALRPVVTRLTDVFPAASCGIRLYDMQTDEFRPLVATGTLRDGVVISPRKNGVSQYVVNNKLPYYRQGDELNRPTDERPGIRQELLELGMRAAAYLPLIDGMDVFGVLYLDLAIPYRFSDDERQALELLAGRTAAAIRSIQSVGENIEAIDKDGTHSKAVAEANQPSRSAISAMKPSILVVDDLTDWRRLLAAVLMDEGYAVTLAGTYDEAMSALQAQLFNVAIVDIRLSEIDEENLDGLRLLEEIKKRDIPTNVIILAAYAHSVNLEDAIGLGAFDVIQKDEVGSKLLEVVRRAAHDAETRLKSASMI